MKILQVIPFFTPARGGSVIAPNYLSKELSKRGHRVTIITTDFEFDEEYAKSSECAGIEVIPIHCTANIKLFLISPLIKQWLHRHIRDFDIVHMHNFRSYQNNVTHYYAKKCGTPYIMQARGSLPRIMGKQGLKKIYDALWGYRLLRDASKVIALTQTEAEQYRSMGVSEDKIEIVPNAIDLAEFESLPPKREFRKKWGINVNQKIILFLGRIHKIKGLGLLVETFSDIVKEFEDVNLVIAGPDDGYLPTLEGLIKELGIKRKVLFTGLLCSRDKLEAYVDADVYVLPSIYETFPNAVLEACVCGTPVIVTDRCGIADVIADRVGLVVPYDKDQLFEAILHLLTNDKMRREFGERGSSLVRGQFAWSKIVEQMENIYQTTLAESPKKERKP